MRKNLYTLFTSLILMLGAFAASAQVNVTYQVDITDYLAGGATLSPNGIRVGGNFATVGATAPAIPDWTPSAAESAMTDLGNNVWSLTVTYPSTAVGTEQLFKFVNGDWGANEGTDAANTIATDGCGVDDGAGNINRTLVIPATDIGYQWCWDHCTRCDGSDPLISGVGDIADFNFDVTTYPNPATDVAMINYTLNDFAKAITIRLFDQTGRQLDEFNVKNQGNGEYNYHFNISNVSSGLYTFVITVDGAAKAGKLAVIN